MSSVHATVPHRVDRHDLDREPLTAAHAVADPLATRDVAAAAGLSVEAHALLRRLERVESDLATSGSLDGQALEGLVDRTMRLHGTVEIVVAGGADVGAEAQEHVRHAAATVSRAMSAVDRLLRRATTG